MKFRLGGFLASLSRKSSAKKILIGLLSLFLGGGVITLSMDPTQGSVEASNLIVAMLPFSEI